MSNLIRLADRRTLLRPPASVEDDTRQRVAATRDVFRECWPILFFPFSACGALLFGWKGFGAGLGAGAFFLGWMMLEMRYGRAL